MSKTSLVAIIEDDLFFRDAMKRLMRSLGYNVEAFPSAPDFLAFTRLAETACLIADFQMPAMNGIDLHEHLVTGGFAIPTIFVTAHADDDVRTRDLSAGSVCYLPKPVDEEHLKRCLQAALNSGDAADET
jgi:FixJ family two-component response regulator